MIEQDLSHNGKITYTKREVFKYKVWGKISPWLFIAPFLLFIIVFSVYPVFNTLIMSFRQGYNPIANSDNGYGLGNYDELFSNRNFVQALKNTFTYVGLVVPITLAFAVFFATLLNKKIRGVAIFQTVFFLPLVTSNVAIGYVWRIIFNADIGFLNWLIGLFGSDSVRWLYNPSYSMFVLVVFGVWNGIPFATMIILSSMQRINQRYYTSARMDNANRWQQFKNITLPMLVPTIVVLAILNMLSSLKIFNDVFIMFGELPGPLSNMYTLVYFVYENMTGNSVGLAAAAAVFLMMVAFVGAILVFVLRNFRTINYKKILPKKIFKGSKELDVSSKSIS